jgi:hypothetical protein
VTPSPPKLLPALLAGLFIGVLSALPYVNLANCCCLWVLTGGFLAAWLQQQNHELPITVVDGAIVGLLAGFAGGIVHYLVVLPLALFLGDMVSGLPDSFMRAPQEMPPDMRRLMNELGPQGMLLIGSMVFVGVSTVFAMIGGILGAVMIKKPSPPPPPVPPVPPDAPLGPPSVPSLPE